MAPHPIEMKVIFSPQIRLRMTEEIIQMQNELHDLQRNADQNITSHSYLRDYYRGWGQRLNIYILLGTAALLCFSLVSSEFIQRTVGMPADDLKWTQGAVAFLAFCLSLIDLTWNPAIKSKAHDQAVAHYQRMNYEIRNLLGSGPVTRERVRWLEEEFLDVAELPRIPENQSLVLKRHHLQKIAISKALELNPHQAIWWLTFKLWWRGPVRPAPKPVPSLPPSAPK